MTVVRAYLQKRQVLINPAAKMKRLTNKTYVFRLVLWGMCYNPQTPDGAMSTPQTDVTVLLRRWREGDRTAEEQLFEIVLPELRRIARRSMARERPDHTLQATELIGQIYARLVRAKDRDWHDRAHFFAIVALTMRRYLIEYARVRHRGGTVPLDEVEQMLPSGSNIETAVLIDGLLQVLAAEKPEWCSIVELKYFLGMTDEETAATLNISLRRAQRSWHDARFWLFERLQSEGLIGH